MKKRIKSYKFWIALSGSAVILVKAFGAFFDFEIDEKVVDELIMSICGVLVVLGIVEKPIDEQNFDNPTGEKCAENEAPTEKDLNDD